MSPMLFAERILAGTPIDVFNQGHHSRDFTYIDDIAEGVVRIASHIPSGDEGWLPDNPLPATSSAPYRILNIGNHEPIKLLDFIAELERAFGRKALVNLLPMQPGDVVDTFADLSALEAAIGFRPKTPIAEGVDRFAEWYRSYYTA